MNLGFYMCGILVVSFGLVGLFFAALKEKGTRWVAGFNTFSEKEQAMYDRAAISRDIRNQCFIWAAVMLVGAVLSLLLTAYMAIPAFIVWAILFFKDFHMDAYKAFEKYLKDDFAK
ncbi:MAG: DUF3784 domain-containing protein [Lachnospiraceae bacterium]|nr:DUF3784 domain-containing protein [Lachnospiraceae bacterium]